MPKIGSISFYLFIVGFVFLLAVLQDYIFSRIQETGFYLSETLLYNTFWVFFMPLTICNNHLIRYSNPKNKLSKLPLNLGIGVAFSFLHLFLFTSLFVLVSSFLFTPTHRFSGIFNAAFSNQFYIALLWYVIFPVIYLTTPKSTRLTKTYPEEIKLKVGSKTKIISTSLIQHISTDRPYSAVYFDGHKVLDSTTLKEFEMQLDPTKFLRVHRSVIINADYITELKSRSNGDYDATLENGQLIRLSRHYRNNWQQLLQ